MNPNRTLSLVALVAGLVAGGCASQDPWLCPRGSLTNGDAASCAAQPAEVPPAKPAAMSEMRATVAALAPRSQAAPVVATAPATASGGASLASLREREKTLADDYYAQKAARQRSIALASALAAWTRSPTPQARHGAEEALAQYRADPVLRSMGGAGMEVDLEDGGVSQGVQDALRAEERTLSEQAATLQAARKANIALVSALEQVARDGGAARSREAAARARTAYESSESALAQGR